MTSSVTIAPFDPARLDAVWELRLRALREHPESFGEPWESAVHRTSAEIEELSRTFWTGEGNRLFVASNAGGLPVGMLGIARELRARERHRMAIWGVYVMPEFRRLGVATALAREAIVHARATEGVLQIDLTVWSENLEAIRSYARLGFRTWGTMPRANIVNGQAIDYDHMVLMLDERPST